jgi:DNA-3-methyladenine glycosylase II
VSVAAALAEPTAVAYLRKADPVMAQLIDARAWLQELPPLDAFGTLIFQVV